MAHLPLLSACGDDDLPSREAIAEAVRLCSQANDVVCAFEGRWNLTLSRVCGPFESLAGAPATSALLLELL